MSHSSPVLVLAEHDNQQLKPVTLHVVTAAAQLSEHIVVLVAGNKQVADQVAQIAKVTEVLWLDSNEFTHDLAENYTMLMTNLASQYTHILAPATTFGKNILPRVAALLDVGQVSDVIAIVDQQTYQRPIYAGNAIATVKSQDKIQCLTIRATAFEAAGQQQLAAKIKPITFEVNNNSSVFLKEDFHGADRPELTAAKIVISGGRGLQNKETFAKLENIANKLGAAIGASRAAVDAGLAPNDWQVGQTGKMVAPQLYIAVGISGAIQHLAGMKDSKIIVAINKDPDAPIFQVADYGLVADLFEVLPQWESLLNKMGY